MMRLVSLEHQSAISGSGVQIQKFVARVVLMAMEESEY
jgi:hypothetical protein